MGALTRLPRSVFGRLILLFAASIVAYALVVAGMIATVVREHPRNQFSERLLLFVLNDRAVPPEPARLERLARDLGLDLVATGPGLEWRSRDGLPDAAALLAAGGAEDFAFFVADGERVAMARIGEHRFFVSGFVARLSDRAMAALIVGPVLLLLVTYANYRAVRWLFRPIRSLKAGADRIGAGDLDFRIPTLRRDELGDLTRSVNAMADRLRGTLEAKRQLLLAISHELRTPLTRAKVLVELVEPGPNRDRLDANLNEINDLVGALLEAEALNDRHRALRFDTIELNRFVSETVSGCDPDGRVAVRLPQGERSARVDPLRVRLLIRNLVGNALKHGGDGPITVTLAIVDPVFRIAVADEGPGIAPEHLPHLGEPFYRPDRSRQRRTGGHGLGLHLCRQIAETHGGRLEIRSRLGEGTTVTATLPLAAGA